jgi:uncharacterized protein with PIN domain
VIKLLGMKISKRDLLSRCVKCNDPTLKAITFEDAMQSLKWDNQDETEIKEFWQCAGCKQIYWEGGNFENGQSMKMLELLMSDRAMLALIDDESEEDQQEPTEGTEVEDNSQGGNVEEMMA